MLAEAVYTTQTETSIAVLLHNVLLLAASHSQTETVVFLLERVFQPLRIEADSYRLATVITDPVLSRHLFQSGCKYGLHTRHWSGLDASRLMSHLSSSSGKCVLRTRGLDSSRPLPSWPLVAFWLSLLLDRIHHQAVWDVVRFATASSEWACVDRLLDSHCSKWGRARLLTLLQLVDTAGGGIQVVQSWIRTWFRRHSSPDCINTVYTAFSEHHYSIPVYRSLLSAIQPSLLLDPGLRLSFVTRLMLATLGTPSRTRNTSSVHFATHQLALYHCQRVYMIVQLYPPNYTHNGQKLLNTINRWLSHLHLNVCPSWFTLCLLKWWRQRIIHQHQHHMVTGPQQPQTQRPTQRQKQTQKQTQTQTQTQLQLGFI
jgi:hypothetical protein